MVIRWAMAFGIPEKSLVILYCGRLSEEKNLYNLVRAYHQIDDERKSLIFVGDGRLRQSLQDYVDELGAESVYFFGFKNRTEIPKFYAMSDVLVLPSVRETWGIVVNEAMCFGLPVIVSNQVGAGIDLVADGENGYRVNTDVASLAFSIEQFARQTEHEIALMRQKSVDKIKSWSHRNLGDSLVPGIEIVKTQRNANT